MNLLFGPLYWGILLVVFGILLLLKGLKVINLPLLRIFIAVVVITFGIRLLFG